MKYNVCVLAVNVKYVGRFLIPVNVFQQIYLDITIINIVKSKSNRIKGRVCDSQVFISTPDLVNWKQNGDSLRP